MNKKTGLSSPFSLIFAMILSLSADPIKGQENSDAFAQRLENEKSFAIKKILNNVSPAGTLPGVVIASPSHDYYFHWVRDASIVMEILNEEKRGEAEKLLLSFAELSRLQQTTPTLSGQDRNPGEPKFNVDGSAYNKPWGRPQDDGPASRALVLIQLANDLLDQGREQEARRLYDGRLPSHSVIKTDLEYISNHWQQTSFDLWEEVRGHHYYTRMVQRKALALGAKLALRMSDGGAAQWYEKQARGLEKALESHWDDKKKIITATLNRDGGADYKASGLDVAVVLGALYGGQQQQHALSDPKLLSTVLAIKRSFQKIYPINQRGSEIPGVAIGRYPEDIYFGGNPWVISTATFAEFHYRLAAELESSGRISLDPLSMEFYRHVLGKPLAGEKGRTDFGIGRENPLFSKIVAALKGRGDSYLLRVLHHSHEDGSLAEQINCHTGFMTSMEDLTWNYASMLKAIEARKKIKEKGTAFAYKE